LAVLGKLKSDEQRRQLLALARDTASRKLGVTAGEPGAELHIDGTFGGAFTTFWAGKMLRGCIGRFGATDDIVQTVREVTEASLSDMRFAAHPITGRELAALSIEISILSDPQVTADPLSLIPGRHGILIHRGPRSGCFLPKVASDRGWTAEEFLSNCCTMKAGLPADAWRDPETEVLLYTADVFAESDFAQEA
jgi:AmmeMemoRadiSam system protein A